MTDINTTARNADLPTMLKILEDQRARRYDIVVPSGKISARDGMIIVEGSEPAIDASGVTTVDGSYRPTVVGDEGFGAKLGVGSAFLKDMRARRVDIYDEVINRLLHGGASGCAPAPDYEYPAYDGNLLLRLLRGDPGEAGVLRAVVSPKFKIIDNLDVAMAILDGAREAGIEVTPETCDLTDRRMYMRLRAPGVAQYAPKLLDGYRSPFDTKNGPARAGQDRPGYRWNANVGGGWTVPQALAAAAGEGQGYEPGKEPVVFAGLVVSNSDVGDGSRWIWPEIEVGICKNGLTLKAQGERKVHLGKAHAEGEINWSTETLEKELELIAAQTKDAVKAFLSGDFLAKEVNKIEALAGVPLLSDTADEKITEVLTSSKYTQADIAGVLEHFKLGGKLDVGGLGNAVTSYSQTLPDADAAARLNATAVPVMQLAARRA